MARPGGRRSALLAVGMGLAVGAALVAVSLVSSRSAAAPEQPSFQTKAQALSPTQTHSPMLLSGAAEVSSLLKGIPQDGTALGRADAPVTLAEYADLQCPYCAHWALGALPTLVEDYVRAGKLRIEFRGLAFIGSDSETALRTALAAGRQDRLWHAAELFYVNQGTENSGWVTEDFLARLAASVPRLDAEQVTADRQSAEVETAIASAHAQAQAANVRGTPAFEIGRTGGDMRPLEIASLEPAEFRDAVEAILAG